MFSSARCSAWRATRKPATLCLGSIPTRAQLHITAPRLKKKKAGTLAADEEDGDLFDLEAASNTSGSVEKDLHAHNLASASREDIVRAFNQLVDHMVPRLGRKPEIATPIRRGALTQLINLAGDREQLENVSEIMKLYHDNQSQKDVVEETDAGDAFITRCITLQAPDLLLRVIRDRPKYGLSLNQRRLHRILHYLASSRPSLAPVPADSTSTTPDTVKTASDPYELFTAALSLLPIYQLSASASLNSPARTDPVVALCLLNLAVSLPVTPEQSADLQGAFSDIASHLGGRVNADEEKMKKAFPALERSQLASMLKGLRTRLKELSKNGIQLSLPPILTEASDKSSAE